MGPLVSSRIEEAEDLVRVYIRLYLRTTQAEPKDEKEMRHCRPGSLSSRHTKTGDDGGGTEL